MSETVDVVFANHMIGSITAMVVRLRGMITRLSLDIEELKETEDALVSEVANQENIVVGLKTQVLALQQEVGRLKEPSVIVDLLVEGGNLGELYQELKRRGRLADAMDWLETNEVADIARERGINVSNKRHRRSHIT